MRQLAVNGRMATAILANNQHQARSSARRDEDATDQLADEERR
jgi:hypothetical protein